MVKSGIFGQKCVFSKPSFNCRRFNLVANNIGRYYCVRVSHVLNMPGRVSSPLFVALSLHLSSCTASTYSLCVLMLPVISSPSCFLSASFHPSEYHPTPVDLLIEISAEGQHKGKCYFEVISAGPGCACRFLSSKLSCQWN